MKDIDVAVVHDRMTNKGGGEKVAKVITESLDADLFVAKYDRDKSFNLSNEPVETNPMRDWDWEKAYAIVRMLDAKSFAGLDKLSNYDVVWMSGMWAPFAARNNENNILYCHSPNRGVYDLAEKLRDEQSIHWRIVFDIWRSFWRFMDQRAINYVNEIVSNSENTLNRIQKYWDRNAEILYPPVDMENFYFSEYGDFWLSVNRLMEEKRVDMQIEAFKELPDENLVIVGDAEYGTAYKQKIEKMVDETSNVEWLGRVSDEKLFELYSECKGTIQTALDEDFGYVPPESMAAGKACMAVNEGGFKESIIDGETGILIDEPYKENLVKEVRNFDPSSFDPDYLQEYAQKFSRANFEKKIRETTEELKK